MLIKNTLIALLSITLALSLGMLTGCEEGEPETEEAIEEPLEEPEETKPFFAKELDDSQRLQLDGNMVRNLEEKPLNELEDNRIGSLLDIDDVFYETDAWGGGVDDFPIHRAQLGIKRMRLLIDSGDFPIVDWSTREESTRLTPRQISTITDFHEKGIDVMLGLIFWDVDAQGKTNTPGYSRFKDEAEIERFLEFTRETVRQLQGKVTYYELLNESNVPDAEMIAFLRGTQQDVRLPDYINLIKQVVPVIKEEDPEAKVAVGAVGNIQVGWEGIGGMGYLFGLLESDIMPMVDAVTFHPLYNITPQSEEIQQYAADVGYNLPNPENVQDYYDNYPDLLRQMQKTATESGFTGEFIADEVSYWHPRFAEGVSLHYPAPPYIFTERLAEKYFIRSIMLHLGMDVTFLGGVEHFDNPSIQFLCTIMSEHAAIDIPVEIDIDYDGPIAYSSFHYPNGDRMLAVWTDDVAIDDDPGVPAKITFPGLTAQGVTGIDVLHGLEHKLNFEIKGESTVISDILVKDYPILIRLEKPEMSDAYEEISGPGFHRLNR